MTAKIAIVGVGCRYPDARSLDELWYNALAGRRAFRAIPATRLRLADYAPRHANDPDSTCVQSAGLIEDFELDRRRFKISAATLRATDIVHWLALDVADRALRDAGFPDGDGLPRGSTGVILGNTLTGEMSRVSGVRHRWPYVARVLSRVLADEGDPAAVASMIEAAEREFKRALPAPNEDTLAGGRSSTIAARICDFFDLGGGGFTVDGGDSSSLLAIAQACSALAAGDLDLVIAGGVDVSLDALELVGLERRGGLARSEMRIYDRNPTGFLPGEGAGVVVLARRDEAEAGGLRSHAVIRGWGVASDGHHGITPAVPAGHERAIARCYARARFGPDTVALFEGHGAGTAGGDDAELAAIARALRRAGAHRPAAIGSIKALIGHTKAAAGVAGLLKATAAVRDRLIPPAYGVDDPHAELAGPGAALRAPFTTEAWPDGAPARAGVSAIGIGGVHVHVVLEEAAELRRVSTRRPPRGAQDVELLVLSAADLPGLAARASKLAGRVAGASFAELIDLAAALATETIDGPARAAVVAATPDEAYAALGEIAHAARAGVELRDGVRGRCVVAEARRPRVGLLFTGQAPPVAPDGGALVRRFDAAARLWRCVPPPVGDRSDARNAQPAIVAASLAAAAVLEDAGLAGDVAIGYSVGELAALAWAGSWIAEDAIEIAAARGQAISAATDLAGAMAWLAADADDVALLIAGTPVVIAACNGAAHTVVSGPWFAVEIVMQRAAQRSIAASLLAASHAFHAPVMAVAAPALRRALEARPARRPARAIVSTVTGAPWHGEVDAVLVRQLTSPVLFGDALRAAGAIDLFIEVGPGRMLATLAATCAGAVVAVDAGGRSLRGLYVALGTAWALGASIDPAALFVERGCKPVDLAVGPRLFANPCEAELEPEPETHHALGAKPGTMSTSEPDTESTKLDARASRLARDLPASADRHRRIR